MEPYSSPFSLCTFNACPHCSHDLARTGIIITETSQGASRKPHEIGHDVHPPDLADDVLDLIDRASPTSINHTVRSLLLGIALYACEPILSLVFTPACIDRSIIHGRWLVPSIGGLGSGVVLVTGGVETRWATTSIPGRVKASSWKMAMWDAPKSKREYWPRLARPTCTPTPD